MRAKRAKALRRYVASKVKASVRRAYRKTKRGYVRYLPKTKRLKADRVHDARCRRRAAFVERAGFGYWSPRRQRVAAQGR